MKLKDLRQFCNELGEEYDEHTFVIRTEIQLKGTTEDECHAVDESISTIFLDTEHKEFYFSRSPIKEEEFLDKLSKLELEEEDLIIPLHRILH